MQFLKNNPQYLVILYGDLSWNFACSFAQQISFFIEKIKKFCKAKNKIFRKIAFLHFDKDWPYRIFLNFAYL